ncbi:MAG: hypothetical protein IJ828_05710 [Treponema sp.]|nr:hypothetical protein [Treponema sp.]
MNNKRLLFSILMYISILLAVMAVFCGENIMKLNLFGTFFVVILFLVPFAGLLICFDIIPKKGFEKSEEDSNKVAVTIEKDDYEFIFSKMKNSFLLTEKSGKVPSSCEIIIVAKSNIKEDDFCDILNVRELNIISEDVTIQENLFIKLNNVSINFYKGNKINIKDESAKEKKVTEI